MFKNVTALAKSLIFYDMTTRISDGWHIYYDNNEHISGHTELSVIRGFYVRQTY